jgi:hypothetical protein
MKFFKIYSFLFLCLTIVNGITAVAAPGPTSKSEVSRLKGNIHIDGRQMLVDGRPFILKGICYNPVRKGGIFPDSLITIHPTEEDLAVIERDFQMMRAAGINTIRSYIPILDTKVLALLKKYELRTIVPVLNNAKNSFNQVSSILSTLKDEPSTLIWEIGNEWNYNFFYTHDEPTYMGLTSSIELLKNTADYIRMRDVTHPISTSIGDLPENKPIEDHPEDPTFWELVNYKNIDLYGINVYDGLTFGNRLTRWGNINSKPLYLSEFGATAYNVNVGSAIDPKTGKTIGAEDENSQADAVCSLVQQVIQNLSALNSKNVLVGGCLFEWNDEWWKSDNKSPGTHDTTSANQSNEIAGPYPDHLFHEKWFGILDIDRNPRAAYRELTRLYSAPLQKQE